MKTLYDWHTEIDEIQWEYLTCVRDSTEFTHTTHKIHPNMYKKALDDFMLFGKVTRYPDKYIHKWKQYILYNTAYLQAMTEISGHTESFPYDTFDNIFYDEEYEESTTFENVQYEFDKRNEEAMFPEWSNGSWFLSDYGLAPLCEICEELLETSDVTEILVLINRALDVAHQRSDLSELFIHGGSESLDKISNYG